MRENFISNKKGRKFSQIKRNKKEASVRRSMDDRAKAFMGFIGHTSIYSKHRHAPVSDSFW